MFPSHIIILTIIILLCFSDVSGSTRSAIGVGLKCAAQNSIMKRSLFVISRGGVNKKKTKKTELPPVSAYTRPLSFYESMVCGAVSRSVAQTIMHPANTMKTILQSRRLEGSKQETVRRLIRMKNWKLLSRGAGAQFLLSVPHGAINFAVLEYVRRQLNRYAESRGGKVDGLGPSLDFLSSAISTFCCSIISTPQMVITDNIMAGTFPNMLSAVSSLKDNGGIKGFYTGWWPGLVGKVPSYGLTWALFQQVKRIQLIVMNREPKDIENTIMGCLAAATTVTIMIPLDTIKTRLVTQARCPDLEPYKGIIDCAAQITKNEGIYAFYRGLAPRLISVVPMIGIQFGIYEYMKKFMLAQNGSLLLELSKDSSINEVLMEVAADDEQPFPAPKLGSKDKKRK